MPINQPSGQIKLTNVSMVRMRKGMWYSSSFLFTMMHSVFKEKVCVCRSTDIESSLGKKRFEIACYQNKVQDWRKGV